MSSAFKFHSQMNENVPFNAAYAWPTQATAVQKQTVKLPPKNGGSFTPGRIIRIEFPADGYLNALNTTVAFDLTVTGGAGVHLQRGGAHNVIKRCRVMYGSMVLEDSQEYKTLVRILTEAGVQQDYMTSTGTILDGMYDAMELAPTAGATGVASRDSLDTTSVSAFAASLGQSVIKSATAAGKDLSSTTRTYVLNLMSGVLTSKKLIPLKWMASQLSIELTLASVDDAFLATTAPSNYELTNVNCIAELLSFSDTYDASFIQGLNQGVPIKFSSWHFHTFTLNANSVCQVHERSRSVKAMFAVIRSSSTESTAVDSDHFFHAPAATINTLTGVLTMGSPSAVEEYQTRVGGQYYPSQPVRCTFGGAEAFAELQKAVGCLGDYTRAGCINYANYTQFGGIDGGKFIMGQEFENADAMGGTIAGINAEEQSDISLSIKTTGSPPVQKRVDIFMHFDSLMIVRAGNIVDVIV